MQVMSFLLRIIIFCDSTTFKKFRVVFLFELQTLLFIDLIKSMKLGFGAIKQRPHEIFMYIVI